MKKLIITLASLMLFVNIFAQSVAPESQKLVDAFVKGSIDVQLEPVDQAAVSKVFTGTFYKMEIGFVETGSGLNTCGSDNYVSVNGQTVKMIEAVHMDLECPVLMSLIKKKFLLKDEAAAKTFEAALNVIYPVDEDEMPNVKHLRKGAQWIFLRGKFFDDYTAFIVTTGATGAATKIELVLSYTVN